MWNERKRKLERNGKNNPANWSLRASKSKSIIFIKHSVYFHKVFSCSFSNIETYKLIKLQIYVNIFLYEFLIHFPVSSCRFVYIILGRSLMWNWTGCVLYFNNVFFTESIICMSVRDCWVIFESMNNVFWFV